MAADSTSRRDFLTYSTAAVAASTLAASGVYAAGGDTIKIALIGAGGRGRGAAVDALRADPNIKLTVACDVFDDRLQDGLKYIKQEAAKFKVDGQVAVTPEGCFTGFDGYKKVLATDVDVVLLCTPPGFRPMHVKAAVEAGKHIFCEKPVAVDAPGVRSIIESAREASKKKLNFCSGYCYRYDYAKRDLVKRVHDGAVGKPLVVHSTYNTGPIWIRGTPEEWKKWNQMEYQMRNWYYYTWLSGDFIVEQACHNADKVRWLLKDEVPLAAVAHGGRQWRTDPKFGHIFDHFSVVYEFPNDVKVFLSCRQQSNCENENFDQLIGSEGAAWMDIRGRHDISGPKAWELPYRHDFGAMYQNEHKELFAAIRKGQILNDGENAAKSSMMAIMGRMAGYTGKRLTWQQVTNSKENLLPEKLEWGEIPTPPVAVPGVTKFV